MNLRHKLNINQAIKNKDFNALVKLGKEFYIKSQYELMQKSFNAARVLKPNSGQALYYLALTAEQPISITPDEAAACEYAQQAFKNGFEGARHTIIRLGRVPYSEISGFDKAEQSDNPAEALYQLGKQKLGEWMFSSAFTCFEAAANSLHILALWELGKLYYLNYHNHSDSAKQASECSELAFELAREQIRPDLILQLVKPENPNFSKKQLELALSMGANNAFEILSEFEHDNSQARDYQEAWITHGSDLNFAKLEGNLLASKKKYSMVILFQLYRRLKNSEKLGEIRNKIFTTPGTDFHHYASRYVKGLDLADAGNHTLAILTLNEIKNTNQNYQARASLEIARIQIKYSDVYSEMDVMNAYNFAFLKAANMPALRRVVIIELEKLLEQNEESATVIYKLHEIYLLEAGIRIESGNKEVALVYYDNAIKLSERITKPEKKADLLFNIAEKLTKHNETKPKAIAIFNRLAAEKHLPAIIKLAEAALYETDNQAQHIKSALATLTEIIKNPEHAKDYTLSDGIINKLILLQPEYGLEVNAIFYHRILGYTSDDNTKNTLILLDTLQKTGNDEQQLLAEGILKSKATPYIAELNNTLESFIVKFLQNKDHGRIFEDLTRWFFRLTLAENIERYGLYIRQYEDLIKLADRRNVTEREKTAIHFMYRYITDQTKPYSFVQLKKQYPTLDTVLLILLGLRKAVENDGPHGIGDKLGTDPGLVETRKIIDANIKLLFHEILKTDAIINDAILAEKYQELKKVISVKIISAPPAAAIKTELSVSKNKSSFFDEKPVVILTRTDLSQSPNYMSIVNFDF